MLQEGSATRHFKTRPIKSIWLGETNRRPHCDGCRGGQCAGRRRESQTAGRNGLLPARPGTQGERTLDRSQGGLGLGLALVKRLVEMRGGRVAARSEGPGKASEFTVRLPAQPAEESTPTRAA
jgi:hypothetical protein